MDRDTYTWPQLLVILPTAFAVLLVLEWCFGMVP